MITIEAPVISLGVTVRLLTLKLAALGLVSDTTGIDEVGVVLES